MNPPANRIDTTLQSARSAGRAVLAPFLTIGFPDLETSLDLAAAVVESGADMLELGVPFSDPLAEGTTVQKTSFRALEGGINTRACLDAVRRLRRAGLEAPIAFMGYYNPYLRYGMDAFVADAAGAGVDGLIVADLPTEESGPLRELCEEQGMHLIPLLAPTSTDKRIAQACQDAKGFIYCVGLTGVTGARREMQSGVEALVGRIRRHTDLPVLVGFGVSRREHVESIGRFADGAVVGSALLDAIDRAPEGTAVQAARDFVAALKGPG